MVKISTPALPSAACTIRMETPVMAFNLPSMCIHHVVTLGHDELEASAKVVQLNATFPLTYGESLVIAKFLLDTYSASHTPTNHISMTVLH